MNSIFKNSKLDEMQEIKLLKIEHYGFWAMFGGLLAAAAIQSALGADIQQYAGELIVLGIVSVGTLAASLWVGIGIAIPAPPLAAVPWRRWPPQSSQER